MLIKYCFIVALLLVQCAFGAGGYFGLYEARYQQYGTTAISNDYYEMSTTLTVNLKRQLRDAELEARGTLNDIGHIRALCAMPCLLDNMGYARDGRNDYTNDNTLFELGPPKYFATVLSLHPHTKYPVVGTILDVGARFADLIKHMEAYPSSSGRNMAFADIGRASSGAYLTRYAEGLSSINQSARNEIVAASYGSQPCALTNMARNPIVGAKYDAMRSVLRSRFYTEQSVASPNLPETIATMGYIRSLDAIPVLADNLTICPQASTNAPNGFVFPAVEALISIGPAIGDCFERLKATTPLSVEEALWLRISHELYPEGLEYELYCAAATNDTRAARLLQSLPWRRLSDEDCEPVELRQEMIEGKSKRR